MLFLIKANQSNPATKVVPSQLSSEVSAAAHYLKSLIRIALQFSLKLERLSGVSKGIVMFLNTIDTNQQRIGPDDVEKKLQGLEDYNSDECSACSKLVKGRCFLSGSRRIHINCMTCLYCGGTFVEHSEDKELSELSRGPRCTSCNKHAQEGIFVTQLQQCEHLRYVALARSRASLQDGSDLVLAPTKSMLTPSEQW